MKTLIIIPSRLSATRLPGKPLLKVNGLSIISHVFKKAERANIGEVVVATEDQEIVDDVKKNGGQAIMTKNSHKTGTDRIYEAFLKFDNSKIDFVMNLQGDEPLMNINDIKKLNNQMIKNNCKLGTLASKIFEKELYEIVPQLSQANLLHKELVNQKNFSGYPPNSYQNRPDTVTDIDNLFFAGDWVKMPFPCGLMEKAVSSGLLAANAILEKEGLQRRTLLTVNEGIRLI